MTFHRAIVERCGVPIVRKDADRRVVFGEVMLPAPRMEEGQKVKESELSGLIHYDGGYMVAEEIRKLIDRFAIRRPIIDVEHDGKPRGATLTQSFEAHDGWDPWREGAWVGGVKIHQDDTWKDVEDDVLRAFSVAFMVKVRSHHVIVEMDVSGGDDRRVQLHEFLDPHPHALSLVKNPATGALWKMKLRAMPRLPVVDREWDADAAYERVRSWAGDDAQKMARAFAGTQVADVEDGRLVVVRSRVADAKTWLADAGQLVSDDDRESALSSLDRYREVERGVVPFQDLPLADEDRQWDADGAKARMKERAGGDDWDPAKYREGFLHYDAEDEDKLGAYSFPIADVIDDRLKAVPKGIFAAASYLDRGDVSEDERDAMRSHLGKYYEKMDRTPPWEDESEEDRQMGAFADHLDEGAATLVDGTKALFAAVAAAMQDTEGDAEPDDAVKGVLSDFTQWSHGQVDELGADGFYADGQAAEDADGEGDGEGEDEGMSADGDGEGGGENETRADDEDGEEDDGEKRAGTFTGKMKVAKFNDQAWSACFAMLDTLREIIEDEETTDKPDAMRKVLGEFNDWMDGLIGELDTEALARALDEPPSDIAEVFRAGRKIAAKRLKKLEKLAGELLELIQDLKPAENEENSERSQEPPAADAGAGEEAPAEGTNVDRSAGDDGGDPPAEQTGAQGEMTQALVDLLKSVQENQGKLVERMQAMESGRPAPGTAGGLPVGTTESDPRAKLRDFFFTKEQPPQQ
jgi:hypothetical protein